MKARALLVALCCAAGACRQGPPTAVALQPGTPCAHCRMTVLDQTLASELVAPAEEPRFFDDLGCLTAYLSGHPAEPGARAFVADHMTGAWVDAAQAVYSRNEAIATPMNSHLVAHAGDAARDADAAVRGATRLVPADVFGPGGAPGGGHDR